MIRFIITIFLFGFLVHLPLGLCSLDVEPDTPLKGTSLTVWESLDLLTAFNCLPIHLKGDALRTQSEIMRLVRSANICAWDPKIPSHVRHVIQALHDQFSRYETMPRKPGPDFYLHDPRFYLQYLYFKDDVRPISGAGIDAETSPWKAYREGVRFAPGHNLLIGTEWGLSLEKWFDISIEPIFLSTDEDRTDIFAHRGAVKLTFGNVEIKSGRSHMYWGQGHGRGNVLFGNNTLPLEMIQIGNPHPTRLPWIFKYLGPFQSRLSLANLDKDQKFPNPYLLSGRINFRPWPTIELGLTRSLIFGGSGAPDYFFFEPVLELLGFRPDDGWIFNIPVKKGAVGGSSGFANNVLGFDLLWRIGALRNSELFFEMYNEDPFDPKDLFPEDSIWRLGLWVPRLSADGTWQFLFQGVYSAKIVYSHSNFKSGFTNKRKIMGLDTGPKTIQFYTRLNKQFFPSASLWGDAEIRIALNRRKVGTPKEYRAIVRGGGSYLFTDHFRINATAGLQLIRNFDFKKDTEVSPMVDIVLDYSF